ncbi:hypothetical protein BGY98DRAFT_1102668 [Russula aff. rugulosa BPL654]|nr:hypothetical protein BGY98DRAFT_1102668 [Russula aff. rugulosa BPL654]
MTLPPPNIREALLGKCQRRDVQAYPVLPYLPIPPNHGIGDESGMLVPEKPVAGVPGTGIPLAFPLNSTPRKWAVRPLPASVFQMEIFRATPIHSQASIRRKEENHRTGPINTINPERKLVLLDSHAMIAAQNLYSDRALIDIAEKNTNQICACIAVPSGVDPTSKPAGSRRRSAIFVRRPSQQVSLPTIDHGGRDHSGIREYPPASAVAKPSTVTISPPT